MRTPVYIFYGPPGAGKGTIIGLFNPEQNFRVIAGGDIARALAGEATERGQTVKELLSRGELAPPQWITEKAMAMLNEPVSRTGVIFDGFPRTLDQADALMAKINGPLFELRAFFSFRLPVQLAYQRALTRGREDDKPPQIKQRLNDYHASAPGLEGFFKQRGFLRIIDASRSIEEVFADFRRHIG